MQDLKDQNDYIDLFFREQWTKYALDNSDEIPDLLLELEKETHQKILHPRMMSSPLQGRLLSFISNILRPKKILEIGTYTGYSSLCLAEGLGENGELHTIDHNEELVLIQQKYFNKSIFKSRIHSHLGNALEIIPKIDGPFDLVFIDADKINYINYFEQVFNKTQPGSLIISDNVMWDGKVINKAGSNDESTRALQKYNDKLKKDSRIKTLLLPFRDGLSLCWVI